MAELRRDGQSWRESADARDGLLCSRDKIDAHFLCHRETDRRALQSNDLKLSLRAFRMSHFVLDWQDDRGVALRVDCGIMRAVVVMLHGFGLSRRFAPHNDIRVSGSSRDDMNGRCEVI